MILALQDSIVGVSPAIVALRSYLPKVAKSSATVLITGATGSGKERVAQAIHAVGPRAQRPFVPVNCAALPESLIESELFGHERGAFTGAIAASRGLIGPPMAARCSWMKSARCTRRAGQAPPGARNQGSSARRIGRATLVDVRVIAATNQPLEERVASAGFRRDLFYRLNVVRLDLPPLKERPEDIPYLIRHVIAKLNARDNCRVGPPDAELLSCLIAHDWPGNIRELYNLVEAVFIDPPGGPIALEHLPPHSGKCSAATARRLETNAIS